MQEIQHFPSFHKHRFQVFVLASYSVVLIFHITLSTVYTLICLLMVLLRSHTMGMAQN